MKTVAILLCALAALLVPFPAHAVALLNTPITDAVTDSTPGPTLEKRGGVSTISMLANFAYGSGGTTANAYVQTSLDGGQTWCDVASFPQFLLVSAQYVLTINAAATGSTACSDGTLGAGTVVNIIGSLWRVKLTTTGTYAGTNISVYLVTTGLTGLPWLSPRINHPAINGTLAFSAFGSDNVKHIYTVTGTAAPVQLTFDTSSDETPEWSPDGKKITFFRHVLGQYGASVWVMNADGSGAKNLSPGSQLNDLLPSFSADGTLIYFSYFNSVAQNACPGSNLPAITSVWTMSAVDGSNRTVFFDGTAHPSSCQNMEPQASPDGKYILFTCTGSIGSQDCRINVSGDLATFVQLTNGVGIFGDPHWSFDSSKIVVSRMTSDGYVNLWTMNIDGTGLAQLTHFTTVVGNVGRFASDPGWSPDGTQIAFEDATDLSGTEQAPAQLALVNVATGVVTDLGIPCANSGCSPRFKP
jgi:WD40-like Beta Propeller Repeat